MNGVSLIFSPPDVATPKPHISGIPRFGVSVVLGYQSIPSKPFLFLALDFLADGGGYGLIRDEIGYKLSRKFSHFSLGLIEGP